MKVKISAIEYYLPPRIEDNQVLASENPDWRMDDITKKTGIFKRHIAAPEETASDLAVKAAEKLFAAGTRKYDIDCLIFVTQSPDYVLPTSACMIQNRLGLPKRCMAFDINLGCSGFVYALALASSLVEAKTVGKALILCGETYTKYILKNDRTCRPLFGDGAAATLIVPSERDQIGPFDLGTDGSGANNLIVKNSGARIDRDHPPDGKKPIYMSGSDVFLFTMNMVPKSVNALLKSAQKSLDDVDLFVFHQASKLVVSNITRHLKLPDHKVFCNFAEIGNTVSATIPIALKDAASKGVLKNEQRVMLIGFGVGYSWGSGLIEWSS